MRKVYSTTAGATFHQETPNYTFCFRKECIEAIIKMSPGEFRKQRGQGRKQHG